MSTTWSEDYCSVNNYFNCNQRKGKRKLSLQEDYEKYVSSHNEANRHPGEKVEDNFNLVEQVEDNFATVKECGWLDEWGHNLVSLTGTPDVRIGTTLRGVNG